MREKEPAKRLTLYIALLFLLMGIIAGANILYYRQVKNKISRQISEELWKASELSLVSLKTTISSQKEQLRMIAMFCDAPDGSGKENWNCMVSEFDTDVFRIGIADKNGIVCYSADSREDISEREYFKRALAGEEGVLQFLRGGFNGRDSLMIASPLYAGTEEVQGVLCAEYTTIGLGKSLNTVETMGMGATLVINKDGDVIASYEGMEEYRTFYDMMDTMEYSSPDSVEQLKQAITSGKSGYMTYYNYGGKPRLLYYCPAGIEDWSIISLVVSQRYQMTIMGIRTDALGVAAVEVLAVAAAVVLVIVILNMRRKEIKTGQKDFLTDVYDRKTGKLLFDKVMEKNGTGEGGCCFFLDIDYFKQINDTKGHDEGDRVLHEAASILKQEVRRNDVVSRYGGDEFCIWLWGITDENVACNMADRIMNTLRTQGKITISMGITFFQKGNDTYETVMKRADNGLYLAKKQGRDRYVIT